MRRWAVRVSVEAETHPGFRMTNGKLTGSRRYFISIASARRAYNIAVRQSQPRPDWRFGKDAIR